MKTRTFLPIVAVLSAAVTLPTQTFAQFTKNSNQSRKLRSVLVGGSGNLISSNVQTAFVGGGQNNAAKANYATIAGGQQNAASGICATIGGGFRNTNSGISATIAGGELNTNSGTLATIGGGGNNTAGGTYATIAGGVENTASGTTATVGGGGANTASGHYAAIGGGYYNTASGNYATIGGGYGNTNTGYCATIGGGSRNAASGNYSFAAGRQAKAMADGSFVWADSADAEFTVSTPDSFAVRANGGVSFRSGVLGFNQIVSWNPGKPTWDFTSDAGSKENFRAIDARGVLRRVASLPVTEWSYKGHNQRNIGPMAQDWHRAFPSLSEDDKTINSGDVQGVSLVAIQGLVEELKERDKAMAARDQTIEELKSKLQAVEKRLNSSPPVP